jgi:hypothetical protein
MVPPPDTGVRRHVRRQLMADLTGCLFISSSGRPVSCLAADVSSGGLRILAREELSPGVTMAIKSEGLTISLVVVWCQPSPQSGGSFSCGLMSTGATDLEMFFVSLGWLGDNRITEEWISGLELGDEAEEPGSISREPHAKPSTEDEPVDVGPTSLTTREPT